MLCEINIKKTITTVILSNNLVFYVIYYHTELYYHKQFLLYYTYYVHVLSIRTIVFTNREKKTLPYITATPVIMYVLMLSFEHHWRMTVTPPAFKIIKYKWINLYRNNYCIILIIIVFYCDVHTYIYTYFIDIILRLFYK